MFVQLADGALVDVEQIIAVVMRTGTISHVDATSVVIRRWAILLKNDISEIYLTDEDRLKVREAIDKLRGIM